jgi:hypothetical protein
VCRVELLRRTLVRVRAARVVTLVRLLRAMVIVATRGIDDYLE